jgi:hypothetical protein
MVAVKRIFTIAGLVVCLLCALAVAQTPGTGIQHRMAAVCSPVPGDGTDDWWCGPGVA